MSSSLKLYKEELMDHFKNPRNYGRIKNPDFSSGEQNPSCGDNILVEGKIENGLISELGFTGKGCAISIATASLLTEACKGKPIEKVVCYGKDFIIGILGIDIGPIRLKCAMLSLLALQKGLKNYLEN